MANDTNASQLQELAGLLSDGNLKEFPDQLTIDWRKATLKDFQLLIELFRYRSFGHANLGEAQMSNPIEHIRQQLNRGNFNEAMQTPEINSDEAEFMLERSRALIFTQQYSESLKVTQQLVDDPRTSLVTRGVAHQIHGHALVELARFSDAETNFKRALELAELTGNTLGKISALNFMGRLYSLTGDHARSETAFSATQNLLISFSGFRWLLGFYRHVSTASFFTDSECASREAYAGTLLAKALGDDLFRAKGWVELMLMEQKFGRTSLRMNPLIQNFVFDTVASSPSDLAVWAAIVYADENPDEFNPDRTGATMRKVYQHSRVRVEKGTAGKFPFEQNAAWIYDWKRGMLIDLLNKTVIELKNESPIAKMLCALNTKSHSSAELFSAIWNLPWNQERHRSVLSVTLQRLRHLSASLQIDRTGKEIRLINPGFII